jgi:hypothetical protein
VKVLEKVLTTIDDVNATLGGDRLRRLANRLDGQGMVNKAEDLEGDINVDVEITLDEDGNPIDDALDLEEPVIEIPEDLNAIAD